MPAGQGDLALLDDPVAQAMLHSRYLARLAYTWTDGTPRVVPIWFHWNGKEVVLGSPPKAPKLRALARNPKVALTIDEPTFPAKVLLVRGTARIDMLEDVSPEYVASAERYLGQEQGRATVEMIRSMAPGMGRITIQPEWVGILDFEQRFPSEIENAMAAAHTQ